MNTKRSKRKTGGRVGRSNERVLQRDRLLRQAKHLPGVADVVDVTRQALRAQGIVDPFFLAPEATALCSNGTS
jgi:hypothetical protein